jgi:bisphosphoglycerate-independent phosphoglycerate mutase (AlkP superfamily)
MREDRVTAELTPAFLKEAEPDFVFCSLGETDEHAHHGDYLAYLKALKAADEFVGQLRATLARAQADGRETLLLVTTDHGRAENFNDHGRKHPESSRAFLFAEGSRVRTQAQAQPTGTDARPGYLKDIAPTVRAIAGLPAQYGDGSGRVLQEIIV